MSSTSIAQLVTRDSIIEQLKIHPYLKVKIAISCQDLEFINIRSGIRRLSEDSITCLTDFYGVPISLRANVCAVSILG